MLLCGIKYGFFSLQAFFDFLFTLYAFLFHGLLLDTIADIVTAGIFWWTLFSKKMYRCIVWKIDCSAVENYLFEILISCRFYVMKNAFNFCTSQQFYHHMFSVVQLFRNYLTFNFTYYWIPKNSTNLTFVVIIWFLKIFLLSLFFCLRSMVFLSKLLLNSS